MQKFADLYTNLDETNSTNEKVHHLVNYFSTADPADCAWAVYFLIGRRPKRIVNNTLMTQWAAEEANIPAWLFGECYDAVADSAETITLLLPETHNSSDQSLRWWVEEQLLPLQAMTDVEQQHELVLSAWNSLNTRQRFIFNKLITGAFRVGVSQRLVIRALARVSSVDEASIAHRLMGNWEPTPEFYQTLVSLDTQDADISRPYPFFLAYAVSDESNPSGELGDLTEWQVEWKWDGIRAQLIKRGGKVYLWSRGEELVTDAYPEVAGIGELLPDGTVLDGELLVWKDSSVQPFAQLQQRIGRKSLSKNILADVPVVFMAYDLLELDAENMRERPVEERRRMLETLQASVASDVLKLSPLVEVKTWPQLLELRSESRGRGVEGFMLKRRGSPYRVGRKRGDWWKWKIEPYTIDAVMIYAQRGSGKRASLYTDYTFAVWDENRELVPFAKAYSGLSDVEIRELDNWIRNNFKERFGPVRSVPPHQVMELGFEGIQLSKRHKSGIAVRFPRILRWRKDKPIEEADTLETIRQLLATSGEAAAEDGES
ncbi:MAG: ATP-dependent DNA ligase [Burkholderiales bacterium]|nr:ATP-dependent DNA ligase [Anaerolineae bacterium]